ncbi:MAG: hypothetical protein U0166_21640 [Acidobacteriota bacterium]
MRRLVPVFSLLVGQMGAAVALADAWDDYRAGVEALTRGDCARAATLLAAAAEKEPREDARRNVYGMHFESYFPHLRRAEALACDGHGDLAFDEIAISSEQGAAPAADVAAVRARLASADRGASELVWRARAAFAKGDAAWALGLLKEALARAPEQRGAIALRAEVEEVLRKERLLVAARALFDRKDYVGARAKALEATGIGGASDIVKACDEIAAAAALAPPEPSLPPITPAPAAAGADGARVDRLVSELRARGQRGDYDGVLEIGAQVLQLDPARKEVLAELQSISRAQSVSAERLRKAFGDGIRAFHSGAYDEALMHLALAQPAFAGSPSYHLYVGATYYAKYLLGGRTDDYLEQSAVASFSKTKRLAPDLAPNERELSPPIVRAFFEAP